ncbi:MAG TPA: N-6 DNA methylase, partial [Chitinophagales bacterium]|nr:N-6 DNA methylase [Chitinophagales bacterium]
LDPSCGSGRMLLASSRIAGPDQYYFGIDLDQTCVKMTALNLFLSGIFHGEVMCANALVPGEFTVSYKTSFLPFGLFRILDKEKSRLWNMYQHTFKKADVAKHPPPEFDDSRLDTGSQLTIF